MTYVAFRYFKDETTTTPCSGLNDGKHSINNKDDLLQTLKDHPYLSMVSIPGWRVPAGFKLLEDAWIFIPV